MERLTQNPTERRFVQNPYRFYDRARAHGPFFFWEDYGLPFATSWTVVNALLRDRRLGREELPEQRSPPPLHLRSFHNIAAHSLLEREPPVHTRLRGLVLRAFTSARIAGLAPGITELAHRLVDAFPRDEPVDLLSGFTTRIPMAVIARLIGIPAEEALRLPAMSHAMVRMYQAGRTRAEEHAAAGAADAFEELLLELVAERRRRPADDLITALVHAADGEARLSTGELVSSCVLLVNAGHEAAVHAMGNAILTILRAHQSPARLLAPEAREATIEECLRLEPPLHLFTRRVYEDLEITGHRFRRGEEVGLLFGAANRDPGIWERPARFLPGRPAKPHLAFGAGIHFCLGAPLARLELAMALPVLFERCPGLAIEGQALFADSFHFRGLRRLRARYGPV